MEERIVRVVNVGNTVFAQIAGAGKEYWSIIRRGQAKPETFADLPQAVDHAVQMLTQSGQIEEAHLLSAYQPQARAMSQAQHTGRFFA